MLRSFWKLITLTIATWNRCNASRMSAAMTFYTILSLAPMLMIAVAIAGYLYEGDQVQQEIIEQLAQVADQQTVTTVEGLLRNATQPKTCLLYTSPSPRDRG